MNARSRAPGHHRLVQEHGFSRHSVDRESFETLCVWTAVDRLGGRSALFEGSISSSDAFTIRSFFLIDRKVVEIERTVSQDRRSAGSLSDTCLRSSICFRINGSMPSRLPIWAKLSREAKTRGFLMRSRMVLMIVHKKGRITCGYGDILDYFKGFVEGKRHPHAMFDGEVRKNQGSPFRHPVTHTAARRSDSGAKLCRRDKSRRKCR